MGSILTTYDRSSILARVDARVKIVALLAYSIGTMLIDSWTGLALWVLIACVACKASNMSAKDVLSSLVPVLILAAFSFAWNIAVAPTADGASRGAFLAVRMVVLVMASFSVCASTTSKELLEAFSWFLSPLRAVSIPVDDIAFTLSLSVRFIPQIEQELGRIRTAQVARGALCATGFANRVKSWGAAFGSLFVGLFRQADATAMAMDARCYGAGKQRGSLTPSTADPMRGVAAAVLCTALIAVAVLV